MSTLRPARVLRLGKQDRAARQQYDESKTLICQLRRTGIIWGRRAGYRHVVGVLKKSRRARMDEVEQRVPVTATSMYGGRSSGDVFSGDTYDQSMQVIKDQIK